jgi:lipoate-protein ligase B
MQQKILLTYDLPIVEFQEAFKLQKRLVQDRIAGKIPDVLLLLEHPPVVTVGRLGKIRDITTSVGTLTQEGISISRTDRGGGVTYHGPGQLMGYPILNLKELGLSVPQYVWSLEEVIIKLLLDLGIYAQRIPKYPGVWVGEEKICAIGLHITSFISRHGFALNVNNDLRGFNYINPCGLAPKTVTSISKLLGYKITVNEIKQPLIQILSQVFRFRSQQGNRIDKCLITSGFPNG